MILARRIERNIWRDIQEHDYLQLRACRIIQRRDERLCDRDIRKILVLQIDELLGVADGTKICLEYLGFSGLVELRIGGKLTGGKRPNHLNRCQVLRGAGRSEWRRPGRRVQGAGLRDIPMQLQHLLDVGGGWPAHREADIVDRELDPFPAAWVLDSVSWGVEVTLDKGGRHHERLRV